MAVTSTTNRVPYVGNGATQDFAFSFYYLTSADFKVWLYDTITKTTVQQAPTTHFTVINGVMDDAGVYSSGGTIHMVTAPLATQILIIVRDIAITQEYHPALNSTLDPAQIELAFDKLTLEVQRLYDLLTRSVVLSDGIPSTVFNPLIPVDFFGNPGATLVQDPTGTYFVTSTSPIVNTGVIAVDTSAGSVPKVLPLAVSVPNAVVTYINQNFGGVFAINIGVTGADTLNGGAGDTLNAGEVGQYWSDGISKWYKLN